MKLEFSYPCRPFHITQEWGVYNEAYKKFGFTHHNGLDFNRGLNESVYGLRMPIKAEVVWKGYQKGGGGWMIGFHTTEEYHDTNGRLGYVEFYFMHLDSEPVANVGDILDRGDYVGLADNTGFSTGPHTHFLTRWIDKNGKHLDHNTARDTFDPTPYWDGTYAETWSYWKTAIFFIKNGFYKLAQQILSSIKRDK